MDDSHKVIRYSPIPKHILEEDIKRQLKDLKVKKVLLTDKAAYAEVEDFQEDIVGFMYDDGHFSDWGSNVEYNQQVWDEFQALKDEPPKKQLPNEDKTESQVYTSFREPEQSQTYEIPIDSPIKQLKSISVNEDIPKPPKQSMVLPTPAETKPFMKPTVQVRPFQKKQQVPLLQPIVQESPALPGWIWPAIFVVYFLWMIFL